MLEVEVVFSVDEVVVAALELGVDSVAGIEPTGA